MASDEMSSEKRICVSDLNNLDEALLTGILIRLPSSKTANRLKLVCKRWCALISSDYFVSVFIHRRHDRSLPPIPRDDGVDDSSYSLVCQFFRDAFHAVERSWVIDFRSNGQFIANNTLDLSFLPPRPVDRILVRASFDDLILCCFDPNSKRTTCFYVCNPLTKQWVALLSPASTDPKSRVRDVAFGFLCIPASCSLCRHPTKQCVNNSRYKFMVVRIRGNCFKLNSPLSELNVELYSSEEGRWRSYVVPYPLELYCGGPNGLIAYRGMLHWLVNNRILVYDPYNAPERFSRVIDLPQHPPDFNIHSFQVCQDRLRVAIGKTVAYTWELEEYDTGKWSLVNEPHKWEEGVGLYYIHVDGNVIRLYTGTRILLLCNTQGGAEHILHPDALFCLFRNRVRQIVNQWWPTPVPSPSLNMQACTIARKR